MDAEAVLRSHVRTELAAELEARQPGAASLPAHPGPRTADRAPIWRLLLASHRAGGPGREGGGRRSRVGSRPEPLQAAPWPASSRQSESPVSRPAAPPTARAAAALDEEEARMPGVLLFDVRGRSRPTPPPGEGDDRPDHGRVVARLGPYGVSSLGERSGSRPSTAHRPWSGGRSRLTRRTPSVRRQSTLTSDPTRSGRARRRP